MECISTLCLSTITSCLRLISPWFYTFLPFVTFHYKYTILMRGRSLLSSIPHLTPTLTHSHLVSPASTHGYTHTYPRPCPPYCVRAALHVATPLPHRPRAHHRPRVARRHAVRQSATHAAHLESLLEQV